MNKELTAGTVLYTSWGYDQTNIDFYQVVRSTDKTVWLQQLEKEVVEQTGWAHYAVKPSTDVKKFNEPVFDDSNNWIGSIQCDAPVFAKKVQKFQDGLFVKISNFEFAYIWNKKQIVESHTC
jgi:hypothetical protein